MITSDRKKQKKPFTSSAIGNKVGWNFHGLQNMELMENKIEERRKQEASKRMEDTVMEEFITKARGKANQRKRQKEFKNDPTPTPTTKFGLKWNLPVVNHQFYRDLNQIIYNLRRSP